MGIKEQIIRVAIGIMVCMSGCIVTTQRETKLILVESEVDQDMSILTGVLLGASPDAIIWSSGEITYRLRGASFFRLSKGAKIYIRDKEKMILKVEAK